MRSLLLLIISSSLLVGCSKKGVDENEVLESMERLSQAPVATDDFLKGHSLIECKGKAKNICMPNGCEKGPVSISQSFNISSGTYKRTDATDTEEYLASISPSGIWYNLWFSNHPILFKVNTLGEFTEVVTQNDMTIVYFGSCQFK